MAFPLGQLYANTDYPDGFNLDGRPRITGHRYQSYGYQSAIGKMPFRGRTEHCYVDDLDRGGQADRSR